MTRNMRGGQGIGARRKDGGQFRAQEADALAHGDPAFQHEGAIWLMMPVRCDTSRSRTRCSACRSSAPRSWSPRTHRRALHGFGNRFGIIEVVLSVPCYKGGHIWRINLAS